MSKNLALLYQQMKQSTEKGSLLKTRRESPYFKPQVGMNAVRVYPYLRPFDQLPPHLQAAFTLRDPETGQVVLDDETGEPITDVSPFIPIRYHYNLPQVVEREPIMCAATFGERCIGCQAGSTAWASYEQKIAGLSATEAKAFVEDKEWAKAHFASDRYLCWLEYWADPKKAGREPGIVKPAIVGKTIYHGIISLVAEEDPEAADGSGIAFYDLFSAEAGLLVYFTRKGTGQTDTRYESFRRGKKEYPVDLEAHGVPDLYDYALENLSYKEDDMAKSLELHAAASITITEPEPDITQEEENGLSDTGYNDEPDGTDEDEDDDDADDRPSLAALKDSMGLDDDEDE